MDKEVCRYLIINADDFGYSKERNEGILDCYMRGAISSSTVLINAVNAKDGIHRAQQAGLPVGLHLNLTEGKPIGSGAYRTLIGADGSFLGKLGFRELVKAGKVSFNEVRTEIQCQIDWFWKYANNSPTHVDGHQHVHVIPGVAEVFASVLAENHINMTRLPLEMDILVHKWGSPEQARFMMEVVENAKKALHVFHSHRIWTPSFLGLKTMGRDMSVEFLQKLLKDLYLEQIKDKSDQAMLYETSPSSDETDISVSTSDETTTARSQTFCELVACSLSKIGSGIQICEFMVHPGYRTRQTGGCGEGPDSFSQSADREHEMAVLCNPRMTEFYTDLGIKLISFCDAAKLISNSK
ncbi:hypothetical protein CHS0354_030660 [Potamilus streckersoni]|uniref:Carbohydrate deacetylase n=1 Tax=Potamilus streckersoni TaxID=2493646 RepID=A0AAE0SQI8_9BIVA|nr:hypothetical protein CHS0354_030660 [Potamilus streckersoni]